MIIITITIILFNLLVKVTKILSFALAAFMAFSVLTVNVSAASRGDAYTRALTADEVATIKTIFDAKYYGTVYLDVVHFYGQDYYTSDLDEALFNHFINCGIWEERQPSAAFNVDVYASRNTDLQPQFGDDIIAYYIYYATHLKEQSWRVVPTLNDAWAKQATIYSVYDFVVGQKGPKAGAMAVQTPDSPAFTLDGHE